MQSFEKNNKEKGVLITGGAGFLGSNLATRLAGSRPIRILDDFTRDSLIHLGDADTGSLEIIRGDVRDSAVLDNALANVDMVVHMAAIAGVHNYYSRPMDVMQVNLGGTLGLLKALSSKKIRRLIYISTSEVYGVQAKDAREDDPLPTGDLGEMRWTYALSKIAGEKACVAFARQTGTSVVILRPFNVFGPGQTGEGAIRDMALAALAGGPVTVYGDGSQVRAWCHVDDFVDAVIAALDAPELAQMVFNIGNPENALSLAELAKKIADVVEGDIEIRREPHFGLDVNYRTPNISRIRNVLGFAPKIGFDDALPATVDWYRRLKNLSTPVDAGKHD